MRVGVLIRIASAVVALGIAVPSAAVAQVSHAQAKAEVEARDAKKHNKLKTEGVPTAAGAVAGGATGGPAGAFAGAKIGHGAGTVIHAVKKHHDIKQVEKHGTPPRRAVRRTTNVPRPTTARRSTTVRTRTVRTRPTARRRTYR